MVITRVAGVELTTLDFCLHLAQVASLEINMGAANCGGDSKTGNPRQPGTRCVADSQLRAQLCSRFHVSASAGGTAKRVRDIFWHY